jgi:hypothetical protein
VQIQRTSGKAGATTDRERFTDSAHARRTPRALEPYRQIGSWQASPAGQVPPGPQNTTKSTLWPS